MADIPPELPDVAARIRRHLTRARADRHHPMRLAWIATIGLDGAAKSRMAVIRRSQFAPFTITLFTDTRARKWQEIGASPGGSLGLFDRKAMEQIRLNGTWRRHTDTAVTRPYWEGQNAAARALYGGPAPGGPLRGGAADADADGFANFGVLELAVAEVDWLLLGRDRHYRAIFQCAADPWTGQWINP
ncbi:MAG: pyridoxamine 5'-phosphate oxidase family protein [Thalassobaculaceae bacterium]